MAFDEIQFDNDEAMDGADYLFRSKKKKAAVKLKKAQKALASGNIKKAEKKLRKAGKVLGKTENRDISADTARLIDLQQQATAIKTRDRDALQTYEQAKDLPPVAQPTPAEMPMASPVASPGEVITYDPGSGASSGAFPFLSGGGGGDIPEMSFTPDASRETTMLPPEGSEGETVGMPKKNTLIIILVIVAVIVAAFFILKKKK